METVKVLNTGLSFLLELALLAALGYWGFQGEKTVWIKLGLGIGTPLAVALLWGLFLAPKADHRLKSTAGVVLSLGLFGLAAFALYQTHHPALATALAIIALFNRILVLVWKQW